MRKRHSKSSFPRRQLLVRTLIYGTLAFLFFAVTAFGERPGSSVLLHDIAFVEGQPAMVSGYGLLVGLTGTGDGSLVRHTDQTLLATLGHLGIDPQGWSIHAGDVAAVLVQAELHPGQEIGMTAPVRLTALGDAVDLAGGTLLPLTLYSRDGRFQLNAEGPVSAAGSLRLAAAPASALVERAITVASPIFMTDLPGREFVIETRGLDPETVSRVANLINHEFGVIACTHSGCDIEVKLPASYEAFDERAALVFRLAALPVQSVIPALLVDRLADSQSPQ